MSRIALLSALAVPALLLAAACSSDDEEPNAVTVDGSEYAFNIAEGTLTPGINTIAFHNAGAVDHQMQLVRLDQGKTVEDFLAAFESGPPPAWASLEGGVGIVSSGGEASATLNLREGTYALLCFLDDGDGVPHFAKGMAATFDVEGDEVIADAPDEDFVVEARDYSFTAPDTLDAGEHTFRFNNLGADLHEVSLLRFPEGTELDLDAVVAFLTGEAEGPPPFDAEPVGVGGAQGNPPGTSQLATVDLQPGTYLLLCGIPNAEGVPHFALGMLKQLKVE